MSLKFISVKVHTTRWTGSTNTENYGHLELQFWLCIVWLDKKAQCLASIITMCLLIIIVCLDDWSQLLPGSSPPITAVPLSLKTKRDVDGQAKDIQPCLEQRELARGIYQHLPWELGSGRVSLATKCMTVVRPGGNFSAIRQRSSKLRIYKNTLLDLQHILST